MRIVFVDANAPLADAVNRLVRPGDPLITVNLDPEIKPAALPELLGATTQVAIVDHTHLPTEIARQCPGLRHVVFLGTGPGSYMDVDELAGLGITVHIIKGYGDTSVAECAIGLMWAAAKQYAYMDRSMRSGTWARSEGIELKGKVLGLLGFGAIAAEVARIALGAGMKVIAWNRTPRSHDKVTFVDVDTLLAESDVLSLHLLLTPETRGFLTRERIARMKPGAILVNTARGALVDEQAMMDALGSGHLRSAGLDVYVQEPMPPEHDLTKLPNVTLSAHSAFRTREASDNLINGAIAHCRRIAGVR